MPRLAPKPYTIKGIRNRAGATVAGAIAEFVDNSFAPGKGEAQRIEIILEPDKRLIVRDNGHGVDDINRLFQIGNHGEALEHDIGEYGVGASHAAIWLGDTLSVTTVFGGRIHRYAVDWQRCLDRDEWPEEYAGKGSSAGARRGTVLCIGRMRKTVVVDALARELGTLYAPGLLDGRRITITDRRTGPKHERVIEVAPTQPPDMVLQPIKGRVPVAGQALLDWTGLAGYLPNLSYARSQVEIGFGHRLIESTKEPFHGITAGVYARVQLGPAWKHALADNKTSVVLYRDDLMASITRALEPLLDRARRETTRLLYAQTTALLEDTLRVVLAEAGTTGVPGRTVSDAGTNDQYAGHRGGNRTHQARGIRHNTDTVPADNGDAVADGDGDLGLLRPAQGILIDWLAGEQFRDDGGTDLLGKVDMSNGKVIVSLNQDQPILQPVRMDGSNRVDLRLNEIYIVVASLIGDEWAKNWRNGGINGVGIKHFPAFIKRVRNLKVDLVCGAVMGEILTATAKVRARFQSGP